MFLLGNRICLENPYKNGIAAYSMALNILMYVLFKNTLQLRAAGDPPLVQLVKTSKETIDVSPVGRGFNGRYGSEQFRFEKHNPGLLVGVVCSSGLTDLNHIRHQPSETSGGSPAARSCRVFLNRTYSSILFPSGGDAQARQRPLP